MLGNFAFMLFEGGLVHAGNSAKSSDCLHEGGGRAGRAARRFVSPLVLFSIYPNTLESNRTACAWSIINSTYIQLKVG